MPTQSTLQHRRDLDTLVAVVTARTRTATRSVNPADIDAWWRRVGPLLLPIVQGGYQQAQQLAIAYLLDHATEAGRVVTPRVEPVDLDAGATALRVSGPVAFKQHVRTGGTTATAAQVMRRRLAASVARQSLAGSRRTIAATVEQEPVILGYQRVTRPDACDFCKMLASRGAVYKTSDRAAFVTGRRGRARGNRQIGQSFHDNCRCTVEPLYE